MTYTRLTPKFRQEFFDLIRKSKNTLITAHYSPDDDAIGSTLALKYAISHKFPKKKVTVAFTGRPITRYSVFTGFKDIKFKQDIADIVENYDSLIFLDGSQFSRFTNKLEKIANSKALKICIDHHASPTEKFDLHLQKPSANSTSELIYDLFKSDIKLDKNYCELLLLGILGDTGTFNFIKPGQYQLLSIVRKILEASHIEIQEFKSRYSLYSQRVFMIIQEFMKNSEFHEVKNWPKFQTSYISRDFVAKHNLTDEDISEANNIFISQYLRIIEDYPWGISFKPYSDGRCSLSLRSLPNCVSVRCLVEGMGIGGGHDRASGATIKHDGIPVSPEEALSEVMLWMSKNKPVIL
ncbi:DHH family phosphoesterase [Candidatus Shapirobacteria bacterium]|nr:DHH family phosphoesterase [Candidatus Shapirobacteria bacterium]